jgi:outer membrane protein assembly factor BamB
MGGGLGFRSPVVANGVVCVGNDYGRVRVYSAKAPDAYCGFSPRQCQPAWIRLAGSAILGTPVVTGGKVYVQSHGGGGGAPTVAAYDATGKVGCQNNAHTTRTCSPLLRATTGDSDFGSPAVANGVVYVGSSDHKLYVFSAAGTTKCSGTPKQCLPLWTGATSGGIDGSPAVSGGVVYIASNDQHLYEYDAAGMTNCSGTPKQCQPLWTANTRGQGAVVA